MTSLPVNSFGSGSSGQLPPDGSLFNQLFGIESGSSSGVNLPYPFYKLVEEIETNLGLSINSDPNRMAAALFPVSQCAHRNANRQDHFLSPRLVVGVVNEDRSGKRDSSLFLKDRLFIGHDIGSDRFEIISYNPLEGKFDFQQVSGYSAESTPQISSPQQTNCTACHQNHGPIFPLSPWSTTDNNPDLFKRMALVRGIPEADIPQYSPNRISALDQSIGASDSFSLVQTFWRQSCGHSNHEKTRQCRAGLFESILQNRLAPSFRSQTPSTYLADHSLELISRNIGELWPDGMLIQGSNIPNSNPLRNGIRQHVSDAERLKQPRKAAVNWRPDNLFRIISGLAGFIPQNHLRNLDQIITEATESERAVNVKTFGRCEILSLTAEKKEPISSLFSGEVSLECTWPETDIGKEMRIYMDLAITDSSIRQFPYPGRMVLGGEKFLVELTHNGGTIETVNQTTKLSLDLFDKNNLFRSRIRDGQAVKRLVMQWEQNPFARQNHDSATRISGHGTITLLQSTSVLNNSIQTAAADPKSDFSRQLMHSSFLGKTLVESLTLQLRRK
ncbi:MAG: hypothetical protein AAF402_09145 [Pseudomonadota bacterium]